MNNILTFSANGDDIHKSENYSLFYWQFWRGYF